MNLVSNSLIKGALAGGKVNDLKSDGLTHRISLQPMVFGVPALMEHR